MFLPPSYSLLLTPSLCLLSPSSHGPFPLCSPQNHSALENHSVDAASTSEAVGFITLLQELKRKLHGWEQQVEVWRMEGIWR